MLKSQTFQIQNLAPAHLDDETLARRAVEEKPLFAALYQRYVTRVYRYQMARCGSAADAEDLCAQTFLAALENIHNFRGEGSFAAWLFGIARRKTALHHRSQRRLTGLEAAETLPDHALLPEQETSRRLLLQRVYAALGALPVERAEAVMLCAFGDLSSTEAGRVLGKSPAAVKMALSRGLHDLRQRLNWTNEELP